MIEMARAKSGSRYRDIKRIMKAGARPLVKVIRIAGPTLGTAVGQLIPGVGSTVGMVGGKIAQRLARKIEPNLADDS